MSQATVAFSTETRRKFEAKQVTPIEPQGGALAFIDEEDTLARADAEETYLKTIMPRKLALDREYVRNASFTGDLRILLGGSAVGLERPARARHLRHTDLREQLVGFERGLEHRFCGRAAGPR